MVTATLERPPVQAQTEPRDFPDARLAALDGYIRHAVWHCGDQDRGELDFDDMLQDARVAVWKVLLKEPDAPVGFIWTVAYHAAVHSLRQGKSVDRPITRGPVRYQVVTLDRMMEEPDGLDIVEMALARRRRHGEMARPTEDAAVASVMLQELWDILTPRQRQVLALRLQQNSEQETGDILGMAQSNVHQACMRIKAKARLAWGDEPPPRKPTPEEVLERSRELRRVQQRRYRAEGRDWASHHRDQVLARRRALYRKQKEQGRDWHARHRDADNARRRARKAAKKERG